jgi:uncharacterized protein YhhL (DUF1145 family)
MFSFDSFITFLFIVKITYVILAITIIIKRKEDKSYDDILFWKQRVEFIFVALMAGLLIFLFNPLSPKIHLIDRETRFLLFIFGIILLVTAHWRAFFSKSKTLTDVQYILGN